MTWKKRKHPSQSRNTSGSAKRPRDKSPASNERLERVKSIFRGDRDPYFPRDNAGKAALETEQNWKLRIRILCLENNDDPLFKEAVQGLVKICFPQGVLEELGVHVLEQHMRESNAPKKNISRMRDLFKAEMVHRLSWMLAEHLDTPQKIETGIASVVAATNRMQGRKLDYEVLDDIISAFQQFRDQLITGSTEQSAKRGKLSIPAPSLDTTQKDRIHDGSELPTTVEGVMDMDAPVGRSSGPSAEVELQSGRRRKASDDDTKKVSKTWRWDIDALHFDTDSIPLHFKRTSDLFAYHTLPAVRDELGTAATSDAIRKKIDKTFVAMSVEEHKIWQESLHRLQNGDTSMLDRTSAAGRPDDDYTIPVGSPGAKNALKPRKRQGSRGCYATSSLSTKIGFRN